MKKTLFLAVCAAVTMFATGCYFCGDPIDESCIERSHVLGDEVVPEGMGFTKPNVLSSPDAFAPRFEAKERVKFEGVGDSLDEAMANAVKTLKASVDCDYVVVVNAQVETKTHPHWCWFLATTNYRVVCSGIPVILTKLDRVDAASVAAEKTTSMKQETAVVNPTAGMIKLSDIQVQINAKGESADKAAVIYPVK